MLFSNHLYLFRDDQSTSAADVVDVGSFTLQRPPRAALHPQRWGFILTGTWDTGGEKILVFTVGSDRELTEWVQHLNDRTRPLTNQNASPQEPVNQQTTTAVDYEVGLTDRMSWNETHEPLPLWDPTAANQNAPTNNNVSYLYEDPDAGPLVEDDTQYLPQSVFQWNLDRNSANELLTRCGTPGVYVLRKGRDRNDVISALLLNEARHFKIFVENNEMFLRQDHPRFRKLAHLIMYYQLNNLPTCHARLEAPYNPEVHN